MTRGRWLALALVVAAAALLADDALARVGGGESFSTGRRPSGGGGGGGGGGDGDLIVMLIWLAIRYPAIGVPLLLIVIAFFVFRAMSSHGGRMEFDTRPHRTAGWEGYAPPPPVARQAPLDAIAARDPGFSLPVLQDHLQLVHRRATEAAVSGDWQPLTPFVAPPAREQLQRLHADVEQVDEVVLAGIRVESARADARGQALVVRFIGSRRERAKGGGDRRVYVEELWTFRRGAGAVSQPPDRVRRMGCPSCGAAVETDPMGRCKVCGTVIDDGRLQWQAADVAFAVQRRPLSAPDLAPGPGGEEPSVHARTLVDPRLGSETRAFTGRHPDFSFKAFEQHVRQVYLELQAAWSEGRWERARPHTTDTLFQSLRFWMDRYAAGGLRNALDDVRLDKVQVVKVGLDAWYESVTVRIWGSMRDYVVDREGRVVGGNDRTPRRFSEYWTFVRAAGSGGAVKDPLRCPSCGAALDKVNQAGVCGYCDTKITTGDFGWVLSRIDQVEVYQG